MIAGFVGHRLRARIGLAKGGQNADRYQFSIQWCGVLVDSLDGREQLLLGSGKRSSLEGLGAEVVFEIEAVELNRQLRVLNAGGDVGVDRVNAQVRVYDVELDLSANGTLALTETRPLKKARECGQVHADLGGKLLKLFRREFGFCDRQSHVSVVSRAHLL